MISLLLLLACAPTQATPTPLATIDDVRDPSALEAWGLRDTVYEDALHARDIAEERGQTDRPILTVIDYSIASDTPRMWVIDLDRSELLFHERVAHGKNSGRHAMTSWSDVEDSKQTSIGVSLTAEIYTGKHGKSLKLDGLEPTFNANNRRRAIVLHGAEYARPSFARTHGRLGNSWGCPAVDDTVSSALIDQIDGGTVLVSWFPDPVWLQTSAYLD